ncbi:Similar to Samui: BAG domain-containing protein Samui (Bombyx mori) [Cotesia congregata]|uniref:Similar to Samui: BAG domain-containing protein Samui (Bombyx mori) n=1 Tax=Cotesia congregata TaxID=51543 RepID=A0A8J2MJ43_COTCN|nr:Similar to Samui: BAG domain-containing protein Samui (Bombyx mori) [Cotesia congregata]
MDSPVIVDTASKFGRDLDPGFPFDDDSFSRRGDIRSHLDDLAARHPEFAEHLLGPPWGDIPFHGTLRNRRRGSGSHSQQGHPDEDARSQASGSSAASAASGASGVSSHGEPDLIYQHQELTGNNKIPQYGLRNTVDIGQHRHNMENLEKADRGQRSMSAPPENRPDQFQQPNQNNSKQNYYQNQNPRFVSRVDITPQYTNQNQNPNAVPNPQQQSPQNQSPPQQQQQQQHQHHQPQGNVRHIPIFVEGRDEPVISKGKAPPYVRQQSPSRFYQPAFDSSHPEFNSSNYQRPSSQFNQHFGGRNRDWPSQFQEHFQDPFPDTFDHPTIRKTTHHNQSHSPFKHEDRRRDQSPVHMKHHQQANQQHQQPQQEQEQEQPKRQESPKPRKQVVPTDPLEKVALVQNEIDSLTEQVKQWSGTSRKDKQYIYLDEMLTRELIKLDDIETEGKENVRQARKNAIKSIQDSISLLESKAPLPITEINQQVEQKNPPEAAESVEPMESETPVKEEQGEAIPLPSPTKIEPVVGDSEPKDTDKSEAADALITVEIAPGVPMETAPEEKKSGDDSVMELEVQPVETQTTQDATELKKENEASTKKEANETIPAKSPKKLKKAKKQTPVSIEPIPLPASEEQSRLAQ